MYAGSTAGGVTIRSELPTAFDQTNSPRKRGGTSAALMRASGQADLGEGLSLLRRMERDHQVPWTADGLPILRARMGVIPLQGNDWFASNLLNDKPSGDVQDFYYQSGGLHRA